jgi:hypothetical protein
VFWEKAQIKNTNLSGLKVEEESSRGEKSGWVVFKEKAQIKNTNLSGLVVAEENSRR